VEGGTAINPYSPPTGDIEYAVPPRAEAFPRALYSPRQMLAGALFGSLLVGVVMLWLNYRAMAKRRQAWLTIIVGFPVATVWVLLAGAFGPVASLQFYGFCNPIQGPDVYRHYGAGGKRASNWVVAALVLMSTVLLGVIAAIADARSMSP
jgi:hypothetical protein